MHVHTCKYCVYVCMHVYMSVSMIVCRYVGMYVLYVCMLCTYVHVWLICDHKYIVDNPEIVNMNKKIILQLIRN